MPGRNGEIIKKKLRQDSQCMLLGHEHVCSQLVPRSASCMESVYLDEEIQVRRCIDLVILMKFTVGNIVLFVVQSHW